MADEALALDSSPQNRLITVTFQRDPNRKKKYLEAEPKALGMTQILLSVHQILCLSILPDNHRYGWKSMSVIVASLLVVIAGSVAIAAKNLHLPTLRGNLGMQIVSSGVSFFSVIWFLIGLESGYPYCWHYGSDDNSTLIDTCHVIHRTKIHLFAQNILIQFALFAISVTLAIYACKVTNCCGPAPKMPVIMLQTPLPAES